MLQAAFIVPHPPIIIPSVGRGQESGISLTAKSFDEIGRMINSIAPETIIITTPHSIMYSDYFHISPGGGALGNLSKFGAADVDISVDYDTDLINEIIREAGDTGIPAGTLGEEDKALDHGCLVPLYFINRHYRDYKLIRIGLSGLSLDEHYKLGMCINKAVAISGRKAVFVASGDLSHRLKAGGPYGFAEEGVIFDNRITGAMKTGDFYKFLTIDGALTEKAAECGLRSFVIMAGALDGVKVKSELYSYENTFGVGYAIASFEPDGEEESRKLLDKYLESERAKINEIRQGEDEYVRLARMSAEYFVLNNAYLKAPDGLSGDMLNNRAGAFVSVKKRGVLRGCIGTIAPIKENICMEIIHNAVSAVSEDPRFEPVKADELNELIYSVDVLSPPESIKGRDELDPARYGVIVSSGYKRGLLLPNLEGIDSVDKQIDIARRKAGIGADEKYTLERFEVIRHK
ncbi:MAG: AmmeMemoRadiSam system protein A [Christensenellales bacterium]|jgi:AmmeMemoRadiSam system protein A